MTIDNQEPEKITPDHEDFKAVENSPDRTKSDAEKYRLAQVRKLARLHNIPTAY